jgi:hypothetical protein
VYYATEEWGLADTPDRLPAMIASRGVGNKRGRTDRCRVAGTGSGLLGADHTVEELCPSRTRGLRTVETLGVFYRSAKWTRPWKALSTGS